VLGLRVPARGNARTQATLCRKVEELDARLSERSMTLVPVFDQALENLGFKVQNKIALELKRLDRGPDLPVAKTRSFIPNRFLESVSD
jgi:hypothetical protein